MADPTCPSCGVPYVDHLGLHGTCAALGGARAELARITELEAPGECQSLHKLRYALREVLATFTEPSHIGDRGECRRSGWMQVERLTELWALVGGEVNNG